MNFADRLRNILSSRKLTLNGVSRRSDELYGRSSKFFVPHSLRSDIKLRGKTPTIQQLIALSFITNYSLFGWLAAFGFNLEVLWRMPFLLDRPGTVLLNSEMFNPSDRVPWFTDRIPSLKPSAIVPLAKLLAPMAGVPAATLSVSNECFLYASVGMSDAHAVPYLTARSIVRANAKHPKLTEIRAGNFSEASENLFLVEYEKGWTCTRLLPLGNGRVALHCPFDGFAEHELRVGQNARILGLIDAEIRPVSSGIRPLGPRISNLIPIERRQQPNPRSQHIGELLRSRRIRLGLSFREASSMTKRIAEHLGDDRYFAAAGTLSDFETLTSAPCHVEKILTLCALYCIGFEQFLYACDLPVDMTGRESIPDELLKDETTQKEHRIEAMTMPQQNSEGGFVEQLQQRWEEIPFFLKDSLDSITRIRNFSQADVFWVGSDPRPRHPLLVSAEFVAVNRRAKKPPPAKKTNCQPPLYLLVTRDGSYLCGPCTLDDQYLSLNGSFRHKIPARRFLNEGEAEVIGQVTAILRRIA
jgi:hypothetical protein